MRRISSMMRRIRIVLEGLRGEEPIAAPFRREGIAESLDFPAGELHNIGNPAQILH